MIDSNLVSNVMVASVADKCLTLSDGVTHNNLVIVAEGMKPLVTIRNDGKVTLHESINLSDMQTLPLDYLRMMREMINTAIYDKENSR
jgi:hypothetical protein